MGAVTRVNPDVSALLRSEDITLATNAFLYVRGMVAHLVLNGYKTRYAYADNEYSPGSKQEFIIPSGYRPPIQTYGKFERKGSTIVITESGIVTLQPNGAVSTNFGVYGSAVWVIA